MHNLLVTYRPSEPKESHNKAPSSLSIGAKSGEKVKRNATSARSRRRELAFNYGFAVWFELLLLLLRCPAGWKAARGHASMIGSSCCGSIRRTQNYPDDPVLGRILGVGQPPERKRFMKPSPYPDENRAPCAPLEENPSR